MNPEWIPIHHPGASKLQSTTNTLLHLLVESSRARTVIVGTYNSRLPGGKIVPKRNGNLKATKIDFLFMEMEEVEGVILILTKVGVFMRICRIRAR